MIMRIVSVNVHYQDHLGYQDYYLGKEWHKAGHDVHFIASDTHFDYPDYSRTVQGIIGDKYVGVGLFFTEYGAKLHRLRGTSKRLTGAIWLKGFKEKLWEIRPDIIVSHGIFTWQTIRLLFIIRKLKCRLVIDDHTTINLLRKDIFSRSVFWIFKQIFSRRLRMVPEKIVGISHTCLDVMKNAYGVFGEKVKLIPLGTDTTIFFPDDKLRESGRKRLGIYDEQSIIITYTGKMYSDKKVHLIIEALNDPSVSLGKNILIYLVGNVAREYQSVIDAAINTSSNPVILENAKPISFLPEVYNLADIAVWPDHLTNSTVDASACGCPIICSNYMMERVIYDNGIAIKGGDISELKAALKKLIENFDLRRDMRYRSYAYAVEVANWAKISKQFLE